MINRPTRGLVPLIVGAIICAAPAFAKNTTSLAHTLVLEGLENPWDMAFLDDGTMFFTEKCKGLSVRMPSGEKGLHRSAPRAVRMRARSTRNRAARTARLMEGKPTTPASATASPAELRIASQARSKVRRASSSASCSR